MASLAWPDHYFLRGGAYRLEIISTPFKKSLVQFELPTSILHIQRCRLPMLLSCLVKAACATVQVKGTITALERAVQQVVRHMNFRPLKPKQFEALDGFVSGQPLF